jgi:hypothetical protein
MLPEGARQYLLHRLAAAPQEWERTGRHTQWGTLSIEGLATLILGHDGYHTHQIAEWLNLGAHP